MTNEPERESGHEKDTDAENHEGAQSAPFWRSPAFAAVAVLIALIGAVWRCA